MKAAYDRICYKNKGPLTDDRTAQFRDVDGSWNSNIILMAAIACKKHQDLRIDNVPIFLYSNPKESLLQADVLRDAIQSLSFTIYTCAGSRARYTLLRELVGDSILSIGYLKDIE